MRERERERERMRMRERESTRERRKEGKIAQRGNGRVIQSNHFQKTNHIRSRCKDQIGKTFQRHPFDWQTIDLVHTIILAAVNIFGQTEVADFDHEVLTDPEMMNKQESM